MPPAPKEPSLLARRNKTTTRAVIKKPSRPKVPPLPAGTRWLPQVREWWKRTWSSGIPGEWGDSELDTMLVLAKLQQLFWSAGTTPSEARGLAGEIRQLTTQLGLTPMARRSLQWELEKPEEPAATGTKAPAKKAAARPDPRAVRANLRAV